MDFLGGAPASDATSAQPPRGRPQSEEMLSEDELLGLDIEQDDEPDEGRRRGPGAEPLAVAAAILALAAAAGDTRLAGGRHLARVLTVNAQFKWGWGDALVETSHAWGPALAAIVVALLARRVTVPTTPG